MSNEKKNANSHIEESKLSSVSGGRLWKGDEDIYCPDGEFCPHCRCMQPMTVIRYSPKTMRCKVCGTIFTLEEKKKDPEIILPEE